MEENQKGEHTFIYTWGRQLWELHALKGSWIFSHLFNNALGISSAKSSLYYRTVHPLLYYHDCYNVFNSTELKYVSSYNFYLLFLVEFSKATQQANIVR